MGREDDGGAVNVTIWGEIVEVCPLNHVPIAIEPSADEGLGACLLELEEIGWLGVEQPGIVADLGGDEDPLQGHGDLGAVGKLYNVPFFDDLEAPRVRVNVAGLDPVMSRTARIACESESNRYA